MLSSFRIQFANWFIDEQSTIEHLCFDINSIDSSIVCLLKFSYLDCVNDSRTIKLDLLEPNKYKYFVQSISREIFVVVSRYNYIEADDKGW